MERRSIQRIPHALTAIIASKYLKRMVVSTMMNIGEVEHSESYSTEAKANIKGRVIRMSHLMAYIKRNGLDMPKKKLIATYCLKEGITKSTAYLYLELYMEAELIVQYGDRIMTLDQYIAEKSGDTERLRELAGGNE